MLIIATGAWRSTSYESACRSTCEERWLRRLVYRLGALYTLTRRRKRNCMRWAAQRRDAFHPRTISVRYGVCSAGA